MLKTQVFTRKTGFYSVNWVSLSIDNLGFEEKTRVISSKPGFSGRKNLHADHYPFGLP